MSGVCAGVMVAVALPPTIPGTHWVKSAGSTALPHTSGITLLPAPAARAKGSVSHVSPLARALMGKREGDEATVAGQSVEIVAVD